MSTSEIPTDDSVEMARAIRNKHYEKFESDVLPLVLPFHPYSTSIPLDIQVSSNSPLPIRIVSAK
jgi:hypothetical protein